jgi:ABC-type polysaccharide/polyol phosphate export permease
VFGNLAVALLICALQLGALVAVAALRGADFRATVTGAGWFAAAAVLLAVIMYGAAETLANRVEKQEEYIGAVPAIAIVPWFFAGSLFPISSLPSFLTGVAKVLPLTHALALMRYGLVDHRASGLREIWGFHDPGLMASASLAVLVAYAVVFTVVSVKVFSRAAVR